MNVTTMFLYLTTVLAFLTTTTTVAGCISKDTPPDQVLDLILKDVDPNHDLRVKANELIADFNSNYDVNKDGVLTEDECSTRWACAYGSTQYQATFMCVDFLGGKDNITIAALNDDSALVDTGLPIDVLQKRYMEFGRLQCVNTDLTVEQKLDLNARYNDHNNDGTVTAADLTYDLSVFYDANNDSRVTGEEWVKRWTCAYGDDGDYARWLWELFYKSPAYIPAFVNASDFTDVPVDAFKERGRKRYNDYKMIDTTDNGQQPIIASACSLFLAVVVALTMRQ